MLFIAQPAACSQMERQECSQSVPWCRLIQGLQVADHGLQWPSHLRKWVQPRGRGITPFWSSDNSCLSQLMLEPLLCGNTLTCFIALPHPCRCWHATVDKAAGSSSPPPCISSLPNKLEGGSESPASCSLLFQTAPLSLWSTKVLCDIRLRIICCKSAPSKTQCKAIQQVEAYAAGLLELEVKTLCLQPGWLSWIFLSEHVLWD